MNFLKRKKKVIIILLIIAVIAGGFAVYQYTRPKEVTNFDVEFEVDQEKPEEEETPGGVEEGIQIPGYESITIPAGTTDTSVVPAGIVIDSGRDNRSICGIDESGRK